MGYFNNILTAYGNIAVDNMKTYMKINKKLASLYNRRIFLIRCRSGKVCPNFIIDSLKCLNSIITNSFNLNIQHILNLEKRLKNKILNLQINQIESNIRKLENTVSKIKTNLKQIIPNNIYKQFLKKQNTSYQKLFNKTKENCVKKFDKLKGNNNNIEYREEWITNLTNKTIPREVISFLSLGPKFSIEPTPDQFSLFKYLAQIETILQNFNTDKHNILRAKITNNITNWLKQPKILNKYQKHYIITKKYLKNNPDIYVILSDKGKKVVILTKDQYRDKMLQLLNNREKFIPLNEDPTNKLQVTYNKTITSLETNNVITKKEATNLRSYNANPPRIFGQIKLHKPDQPLRPIVDNAGSIFNNLCIIISKALSLSFTDEKNYIIKDTFHLVEELNEFQLPPDHILASFDVVNMFPSIPFQLIQYDVNLHWKFIKKHTNLDRKTFLNLLQFMYDNNYFIFENTVYKQLSGTQMGSSLSPKLACRVIYNLFVTTLDKIDFQISFFKFFVDDSLVGIPKNKVNTLLNLLNNYNKNIQFTVEIENNNKEINFLDTTIIRHDNNTLRFKWFRKPTASNRFLNFHSYTPLKYKINTIKTLTYRIKKISHHTNLHNDLKNLQSILIKNDYPTKIINPILFSTSNNVLMPNPYQHNNPLFNNNKELTPITYNSLYYIQNLTPAIKNIFHTDNTRIAYKSFIPLNNIFTKTKTKIDPINKTDVIYKIECSCKKSYIGQTSQQLKSRLAQHFSAIRKRPQSCALSQHCHDNKNHTIDNNKITVLDIEHNTKKRLTLEMFYINLYAPNTINKNTDINNISIIYSNILELENQKIKNKKSQTSTTRS